MFVYGARCKSFLNSKRWTDADDLFNFEMERLKSNSTLSPEQFLKSSAGITQFYGKLLLDLIRQL